MKQTAKYRFISHSLFKYDGVDAYTCCAVVPSDIRSMDDAVKWYESEEKRRGEEAVARAMILEEREACAKIFDAAQMRMAIGGGYSEICANAIRARSNPEF